MLSGNGYNRLAMKKLSYQQALDYLYSFVDYSLKHADELAKAEFNLERMRQLMQLLGEPQTRYPTLHIAGTKGKGSTAALTASVYQAAGYRVGLYTSPHMEDFAERIQVDGTPIPHADLSALVEEIQPAVAQVPYLTTFELTTALAFLYFARRRVDIGIIEVGLGGRLDATNIITPLACAITPISFDHTAVLGNTLAQIAAEKGGIIKPDVPVVLADQPDEAHQTLAALAAARGAPLIDAPQTVQCQVLSQTLDGQTLQLSWRGAPPQTVTMPLLGPHQAENAVTAWALLHTAAGRGLPLSPEALTRGFAAVHWPGRFEVFARQPLIILDGAHNEAAAIRLTETLQALLPAQKAVLLFGVSEDKDAAAMLHHLAPWVDTVIFSRAEHPRATRADQLLTRYAPQLPMPCEALEPVEAAVSHALRLVQAAPRRYLLSAGSIFLTAAVRATLKNTLSDKGNLHA